MRRALPLALAPLVLLVGCPKDEPKPDDTAETGDSDTGGDTDSGGGDTDTGGDTGPDVHADCKALGLPVREWEDATEDASLGATAADLELSTTEGTWRLSDQWSGCDTYLFIPDFPTQNAPFDNSMFEGRRDLAELFDLLPKNTQLFFVSTERDEATRAKALSDLENRVGNVLDDLEPADQEWWADRVHYLTEKTGQVGGWLGTSLRDPGFGNGIDRFQKIRYIGSFADVDQYDGSVGWFTPNVKFAAYEAIYYNFEADRQARMDAESATVIPIFDGQQISDPHWAGQVGYADLVLPDAATMATFDRAEFDHSLLCVGEGEYGTCPAWDYLNWLWLCDADEPTNCPTEIGRWITTYHREGRWVHDVTGILPLLAEGGTRRVAYYTQQPYEVHLSLRLYASGEGEHPAEYVYLFSGGSFGEAQGYNDREPLEIDIPADATKVELVSVISGHGGEAPYNCAEFCDTDHHFFVNGTDHVRSFPEAGTSMGCADTTGSAGPIPNQFGTWWYGRNGWCPGKEVPQVREDITGDVVPGATNVFDYEGYRSGQPYEGSSAWIALSSWLVIYR